MPSEQAATMSSPLSPPGTVGNCVVAYTATHSDATATASAVLAAPHMGIVTSNGQPLTAWLARLGSLEPHWLPFGQQRVGKVVRGDLPRNKGFVWVVKEHLFNKRNHPTRTALY